MDFLRNRSVYDKTIMGLAALGTGFMSYLTYLHFESDGGTICDFGAGFSCQIVNQSLYSEILGVPVAVLGLTYFIAMFAVAATRTKWADEIIQLCAIASLVFSFYLSGIEYRVLATICIFCELSKVLMLCIFLASYRGARANGLVIKARYFAAALLGGAGFTLFAAMLHF